jgi:nucleotide-binding universal stress UspA family protein
MMSLKRVLVATDFSETSEAALKYGIALAGTFGASVHVLHVVTDPMPDPLRNCPVDLRGLELEREENARKQVESLLPPRASGRSVVAAAVSGNPSHEILRYACDYDVDLIVCGTHGVTGWRRLVMGSVAEILVRKAPCPVLTVHHPEHEFVLPDAPVSRASCDAAA